MTTKVYIIPFIIQLLAKTIEDIPPKYLLNDFVAVLWFPLRKNSSSGK